MQGSLRALKAVPSYRIQYIIIFLPSVFIPEGGLKIDENKLKGYDAKSVQSIK